MVMRNDYIRGTALVGLFGDKARDCKVDMICTSGEERCCVYWENDAKGGAARLEENQRGGLGMW